MGAASLPVGHVSADASVPGALVAVKGTCDCTVNGDHPVLAMSMRAFVAALDAHYVFVAWKRAQKGTA